MPGLIGKKLGMTQIFDENDNFLAVTVIEVGENTVIRHKTADGPDGYTAVQLGLGEQKAQRVNKPETGHFAANNVGISRHVREIRVSADDLAKYPAGGTLKAADLFAVGVVLWKMLTGVLPMPDLPAMAAVGRRLHSGTPPIRESHGEVPVKLAQVIDQALALEADDRFPDAQAMRAALRAAMQG